MSKRKRVLLWAGLLVVLTGVGLGAVQWMTPPVPGVTWANYQRIEIGMKVTEVETLLGGGGFYFFHYHQCVWSNPDGSISISLDRTERVTTKQWTPGNETLLARLRRRLGL